MGSKLYVGGLPYSATQTELTDLFSAHGTVQSANVISDKFTGQSRGFGFVEMSSGEEAQAAISALNSTEFGGRTLTVNEAKPQAPRTGGVVAMAAVEIEAAGAADSNENTKMSEKKGEVHKTSPFFIPNSPPVPGIETIWDPAAPAPFGSKNPLPGYTDKSLRLNRRFLVAEEGLEPLTFGL